MDIASKEQSILKLRQLINKQENELYNKNKNNSNIQHYFKNNNDNINSQIDALNRISQYLDKNSYNIKDNTLLIQECINDKKLIKNEINNLKKLIQQFQ